MLHKRLINRKLGALLLPMLGLMLVTGGSASFTASAAVPTTPSSPQRQQAVVLHVYFHDNAERDALATELGAEEMSTLGGYLTVWTDWPTYDKLLARGLRVEIDRQATDEVNAITFGQGPARGGPNTFYGGYRTVEEMQTFL